MNFISASPTLQTSTGVLQEEEHPCGEAFPGKEVLGYGGLCRPRAALEAQEAWASSELSACSFLGQKRGRDHNPAASVLGEARRREGSSVALLNIK